MGQPVIQPSLAAGELSPALFARVDLGKWHVGAALLRNFQVNPTGGASNRVGTEFIVPALPGINRLIDFTFSVTQTYALAFSNLKLRFITNGGVLLEASTAITGASQANPCVITDPGHGYANNDWVFVASVGGMTRLNGRFFIVQNALVNSYSLTDTIGAPIDSAAFAAYTSGGTAARVYTIASPYAAADLALLKYVQSADVMTLTHPNYQTRQLIRSGATSWAFSAVAAAASMQPPTALVVTPAVGGAATGYRYKITSLNAQGVESGPSAAGETLVATTMSTTAAENIAVSWTAPATGPTPTIYKLYRQIEVPGGVPSAGELYGYVGSSSGLSFVDHNILPDFTQTPPIAYDPFAGGVYPGCSTYYQGRQVYAGATSLPETMNFTKTGDFFNFSYSSPARANDGIVATIASRKVNAIKHMVPMQSLVVLSASGAWRVDSGGTGGGAITPTNISATPQAFNGCSDVPPIAINYDILYVQAKGSIVRDLAYNFYVNVYTGQDLTVLSAHLFFGHTLTEWAWAEEPFKIVWAVREDGYLLSLTYLKEQDVYAWAHHDTNGQFKSVCSISEGNEDAVYLAVQRLVNGYVVQYIERMASRNMGAKPDYSPPVPAHLDLAWFVDCGLSYGLTYPNATITPLTNGRAPSSIKGATIVYSAASGYMISNGSGYSSPTVAVNDAIGTGTDCAVSARLLQYMNCPGNPADFASTPFSVAMSITGDIELAGYFVCNDWAAGGGPSPLMARWITPGNNSFRWRITAAGVRFQTTPNGVTDVSNFSSVGMDSVVSDGGGAWMRVRLVVSDGAGNRVCYFHYSLEDPTTDPQSVTWVALGNVITTAGATSIFVGTSPLQIGGDENGAGATINGKVYRAQLYGDVGGSLACDFMAADGVIGETSFVSAATGETYTLGGITTLVSAGVASPIYGLTVTNPGQNYQRFTVTISDPTGTGAVGQLIPTNDVVMNLSGAVIYAVGDMVRVNDGWGPVRVVNSTTRMTVNVQQPLSNIFPTIAGSWSCTTPVSNIGGLDHLEGMSVSVLADGGVVANGVDNVVTVTNGALNPPLPQPASAIFVGLGYTSQLKSLPLDIPGQTPTVQGKRMSINAVTLVVQDSRGLAVGHDFNDMTEIKERNFEAQGQPILPITGYERIVVGSNWERGPSICAQQINPLPATILGLIPELVVGDN